MKWIIFFVALAGPNLLLGQSLAEEIIASVKDSVRDLKTQVDIFHTEASSVIKTQPDVAKALSQEMMIISEEIGYDLGIANSHYNLGVLSMFGPYPEALKSLNVALELYLELADTRALANTWVTLAIVYQGMEDKAKAIDAATKARHLAEDINDLKILSRVHTNFLAIYHYFDRIDSSLYHGKIALKLKRQLNDTRGIRHNLLNLGVVMANIDSLVDEGLAYMLEARILANEDPIMVNDIVTNIAYGYARKKNFTLAEMYLDSAIVGNDSLPSDYTRQGIHRIGKDLYLEKDDFEKALFHLEKEYALDKKLRSLEAQEQFEVLELERENATKEKEIIQLEKEQAEIQFRLIVALLGGTLMVVLVILVILIYRNKMKLARMSEKELKTELNHKNKELASFTLNFVQKNEMISNIKEQVQELSRVALPSTGKQLQQINRVIEDTFRADREWENFKLRFEEVHEGFFKDLSEKYPDLGNAEVKLCALLRLNMNLKESSQVLGISPDSVKTARYRIRKKLGLTKDENLVKFMSTIGDN